MVRILKKTRVKGLPPRVQLQGRDAASGSYPTQARLASDNRLGTFRATFNDKKIVNFISYQSGSIKTGFSILAASGTYPNYALGPGVSEGGNVLFLWRFEDKIFNPTNGKFSTSNAAGSEYSASFGENNYGLSPDVPSYYNNISRTYSNQFCLHVSASKTSTIFTNIIKEGAGDALNNPYPEFTISTHFKASDISGYFPIAWRGLRSGPTTAWEIFITEFGQVQFVVYSDNTHYRVYTSDPSVITTDTWYHLALSVDNDGTVAGITPTLYINGSSISFVQFADTGWSGFDLVTNQIYAGGLYDSLGYLGFDRNGIGFLDEFTVADRAITAAEAVYLYSGNNGLVEPLGLMMPTGLHSLNEDLYITNRDGMSVRNPELTTDIAVSGLVRKGIGDSFIHFTPGEDIQPFRDSKNNESDGKSVNNPFFATGSLIGEIGPGFDQPLWSKSKIEIDLTPSSQHSFFIENFTSGSRNHPMAYWNNDLKKWQGLGAGKEFGVYPNSLNGLQQLWDEQPIGFLHGLDNGGTSVRDPSVGAVISNYGFPYHAKYHASSSNTISMSDYLTTPFLLEKIVLEFSGSLALNNTSIKASTRLSMTTFFILNQRSPFAFHSDATQQIPYGILNNGIALFVNSGANIPETINGEFINTSRDLVTWAQISSFAGSEQPRMTKELNLSSFAFSEWNGRFLLSGTVKSPLSSEGHAETTLGNSTQFMSLLKNSTRSGLFVAGGRDFISSLDKGNIEATTNLGFSNAAAVTLSKYSKTNPYLLLPTDKLILGWQLPLFFALNDNGISSIYNTKGPELTFPLGPAKITLYGSQVADGKEFHDTLNQHLTSVTAHEVIG